MKNSLTHPTRREFLRQSACGGLGLTGIFSTLAHLKLMDRALAAEDDLSGYKALVVIFLYGGNDSNNMLIPQRLHTEYGRYKSARQQLKIYDGQDAEYEALPTNPPRPSPSLPISFGAVTAGQYGVHPNMSGVQQLFNTVGSGGTPDLAFVANVGSLAYPIADLAYYTANPGKLPPQLFSHSDQQTQWQSSIPDRPFSNGWGGRVADGVADILGSTSTGEGKLSFSISLSGVNSFQVGSSGAPYAVSTEGAIPLAGYGAPYDAAMIGTAAYNLNRTHGLRLQAFDQIKDHDHAHRLEEGYAAVVRRARDAEGLVGNVLGAGASAMNYDTTFGTGTAGLIGQLKMVAKLIAGRNNPASASRQIFFCSIGGFDTHASQMGAHAALMQELSVSLAAFHSAMVGLGVNNDVLTLTHSDFTRTLTPNSDNAETAGSDHGWGGHQIVMGGAVKGGRIYGAFPPLLVNAGLDVNANRGRWIPTTSVDQYAAVAARWFGDNTLPIATIFPNLHRFTDVNLGYVLPA